MLTSAITSDPLSSCVAIKGSSLNNHWIVGGGFPSAVQLSVILSPSTRGRTIVGVLVSLGAEGGPVLKHSLTISIVLC